MVIFHSYVKLPEGIWNPSQIPKKFPWRIPPGHRPGEAPLSPRAWSWQPFTQRWTHEEWICVWEIYYWIYIGYGDISTILGIYWTYYCIILDYCLVYIYIYWIWEYTDDILLMLVILKILDILMIYYSYWDILLDVCILIYWYMGKYDWIYIYILGYECSQKFSWYWYIGYTGKILLEEYGDIYGVYMGFI